MQMSEQGQALGVQHARVRVGRPRSHQQPVGYLRRTVNTKSDGCMQLSASAPTALIGPRQTEECISMSWLTSITPAGAWAGVNG